MNGSTKPIFRLFNLIYPSFQGVKIFFYHLKIMRLEMDTENIFFRLQK